MDGRQRRKGAGGTRAARLRLFLICSIAGPILAFGCSHLYEGSPAGSAFKEANDLFGRGSYEASLSKYEEIVQRHPAAADRALFEMGILYAYPSNEQRDYEKSLRCFRKILDDYPESGYRQDSAKMISHIDNASIKERRIIAQQAQIGSLEQAVRDRERESAALRKEIEALEREIGSKEAESAARQERIEELERELAGRVPLSFKEPVSRVLIEKEKRRLTLISGDRVLKAYRIALGGNPKGPKEKQGDNKTPEGLYIIDARNTDSAYHLSLHISYPNEEDLRRARELNVPPGGNIMIHGLKNGYSRVGGSHAEIDWTKGCIAVTDEEIEEIARLVPNGTVVEIKP